MKKTAGIVADNYKVEKFKKELTKKGFTDFEVYPFTKDTSQIQVHCSGAELLKVKRLCEEVEDFFNRRKSSNN